MAQADVKMQEVINHHNELRRETTARRDAVRGFLAAIGQSSLPQSLNDALKSLGDSLIKALNYNAPPPETPDGR